MATVAKDDEYIKSDRPTQERHGRRVSSVVAEDQYMQDDVSIVPPVPESDGLEAPIEVDQEPAFAAPEVAPARAHSLRSEAALVTHELEELWKRHRRRFHARKRSMPILQPSRVKIRQRRHNDGHHNTSAMVSAEAWALDRLMVVLEPYVSLGLPSLSDTMRFASELHALAARAMILDSKQRGARYLLEPLTEADGLRIGPEHAEDFVQEVSQEMSRILDARIQKVPGEASRSILKCLVDALRPRSEDRMPFQLRVTGKSAVTISEDERTAAIGRLLAPKTLRDLNINMPALTEIRRYAADLWTDAVLAELGPVPEWLVSQMRPDVRDELELLLEISTEAQQSSITDQVASGTEGDGVMATGIKENQPE